MATVLRLRQWTDYRLQIGGKKIGEKYVDQTSAQVEKMSVSTPNAPPNLQGTIGSGWSVKQLFLPNFIQIGMGQGTPVCNWTPLH